VLFRLNKRLMRFLLATLTILVFSAIVSWYLPWWTMAVIAFGVAALFRLRPGAAFLAGALAIFLFWLIWGFVESSANNHILLPKLAELFHLPAGWVYLLISSLLGALVGGIAACAGAFIRNAKQ
jgi:hypothetical protein